MHNAEFKRLFLHAPFKHLVSKHRGAAEKRKRENDVHLRQLAKKSTYVPSFFSFFLVRFWAFLGKGSSKTREKKLSTLCVSKQITGEMFFRGGIFFW
jgi:hypothetical protein